VNWQLLSALEDRVATNWDDSWQTIGDLFVYYVNSIAPFALDPDLGKRNIYRIQRICKITWRGNIHNEEFGEKVPVDGFSSGTLHRCIT
jgi:hypothetical protein